MNTGSRVSTILDRIIGGERPADLEDQNLEFTTDVARSSADTLRLVAEAAACMANSAGGTVIVGVDDRRGGVRALVGTKLGIDAARWRIFELTDPGLVVGIEVLSRDGIPLLVLSVPPSPTVHAVSGRCTERVGDTCQPMTPERIAAVTVDRRAEDWSAADSGSTLIDLDPVAVRTARSLLEQVADPVRQRLARRSEADLMRGLGLLTGRATLTNAGALLFTAIQPGQEQLAYFYRRSSTGSLVANEHLHAPLLVSLQRAFDLIDARVERTSVNVSGGQQLQLAGLPELAVREALVNAVMHRDYRRPGPVVAQHTPTHFAVTSPGPFLAGITPANVLTTSSRTRNPQLATAIRSLGLAETAGTGVDRMFAAMARIGRRPPQFVAGLDDVEVSLAGGTPNPYVARFAATLPADEAEDADTMMVLLHLLDHRTINATAASPLLQREPLEAQTVLTRLATAPVARIEPTRETANRSRPNYRLRGEVVAALGPAVAYNRRTTDDYDRKILGLVREAGEINGRMVKLLLDLDTPSASRVLGDLVERGVLVKTSTAQRGPGVTYGPGPAFPTSARRGSPKQ